MGSVIPSASDGITSALPTSVKRFCFADTGAFLGLSLFVNRGAFPSTDLVKLLISRLLARNNFGLTVARERSEEAALIGRDALLARCTVTCITAPRGDRLHVG